MSADSQTPFRKCRECIAKVRHLRKPANWRHHLQFGSQALSLLVALVSAEWRGGIAR